jgi:hypothetical protein
MRSFTGAYPSKSFTSGIVLTRPEAFGAWLKDAINEAAFSENGGFPGRLNNPIEHSAQQSDQNKIEALGNIEPPLFHDTNFFPIFQVINRTESPFISQ